MRQAKIEGTQTSSSVSHLQTWN